MQLNSLGDILQILTIFHLLRYRNEKPIEDSSRITTQHDFGFVSMDISHIRDDDQGVYMCRAGKK